ncbi:hypothetical protein A0H81_06596 [Grifola frondosa]|uniref:Uncharacterized protein n=1 Tax=Grifola frondosa TaxID=5627 RepID=A0A1C7M9J2_GRIFR|nr:hypothetical protein A0H81_06596 [Grifola frondosa]
MIAALSKSDIYAALYGRHDERYHWAFILATDDVSGYKYHASNLENPAVWQYVCEPFDTTKEWKPLVILAKLGRCPPNVSTSDLDRLFRSIPLQTPESDAPHPFTCRIWFRTAMRALNDHNILSCVSVSALEWELVDLANDNATAVGLGRPWKLYVELRSCK